MTFYDDLTPYAYSDDREIFTDVTRGYGWLVFRPRYERTNIGWLSGEMPWTSGPTPVGFAEKLVDILSVQAVNEMMGLHDCDLCPPSPLSGSGPHIPRPGHRRAGVGTGEIRVPGADGVAFAAPMLIGHYVIDHGYLPPRSFVEAVLGFEPERDVPANCPWVRFPWIPEDAVLTE
jgi:hypothetical protein